MARGWRPRLVHSGILLLATSANDDRVAELRAWVRDGFPIRAPTLHEWLRDPSKPAPGARSLAMIDPYARRADWLRSLRLDGRRTPPPYRDYADVARRVRGG